jgi:hypothetical protein
VKETKSDEFLVTVTNKSSRTMKTLIKEVFCVGGNALNESMIDREAFPLSRGVFSVGGIDFRKVMRYIYSPMRRFTSEDVRESDGLTHKIMCGSLLFCVEESYSLMVIRYTH